jgi:hypothetical protein
MPLKEERRERKSRWTTFFNFIKYPSQVQNDKALISRLFFQAIENKRSPEQGSSLSIFMGTAVSDVLKKFGR